MRQRRIRRIEHPPLLADDGRWLRFWWTVAAALAALDLALMGVK